MIHALLPIGAIGHSLARALSFAFGMFWEILWALILGFFLSAAAQALVALSAGDERIDHHPLTRPK